MPVAARESSVRVEMWSRELDRRKRSALPQHRRRQECWPYAGPFQAGQPLTLTSSCNADVDLARFSRPTSAASQGGERGR